MNPELEQFESVRRLLALKRHEQPPPGYFDGFSVKIVARIQAEQAALAVPWWQRWLCFLEDRPLLAGASGVACCGMLLCGLSLFQILSDATLLAANSSELLDGSGQPVNPTHPMLSSLWGSPMAASALTSSANGTYNNESTSLDYQMPSLKALAMPVNFQYP
jgi:hypothetical protein